MNDSQSSTQVELKTQGRRRFLRGSLAVAPLTLTLTSRPVLAWHCKTPSAHGSVTNASHHPGAGLADDNTQTIAHWQNSSYAWPSPYARGSTKFHDTSLGFTGSNHGTQLMKTVLASGTQLEKYLIAALLNRTLVANAGMCLTRQEICEMNSYGPTGNYQPTTGVLWGNSQIIAYLQANYIVTG